MIVQSMRRTHQKVSGKPRRRSQDGRMATRDNSTGEKEDNDRKVSSQFDRAATSDYFLEQNFRGWVRLKRFAANLSIDTNFVILLKTSPSDSLPAPVSNFFPE